MKTFKFFTVGIVLVVLMLSGAVFAQAQSNQSIGFLPDSSFYFLKIWKESIQTFFTFGNINKAEQYLHLAEIRFAEYQKMMGKGKTEIAEKTLEKYEKQLNRAIDKTKEAKAEGKDARDVRKEIDKAISGNKEVLQRNLEKAPEQAKKGLERAIESSEKAEEKIKEEEEEIKEEETEEEEEVKTDDNQDEEEIETESGAISPFGVMAAFDLLTLSKITASDKSAWVGSHLQNLGAKWSRAAGEYVFWGNMEPEIGKGYDWSKSDEVLKRVYENSENDFNMIVIVGPQRGKGSNPDIPSGQEEYFKNFVKALVERYDGDGVGDYDSDIKVKYWQADNEPFPRHWELSGGTKEGYIKFVELFSAAIKESDQNAKIILGTFSLDERSGGLESFSQIVSALKNKNLFDYADTHFWKSDNEYKISIASANDILDVNGYSDVKWMALEFGTWAEMGRKGTEKEQAIYLIKGFIYNIANGFAMINWNNLVEWNNYGGNPNSIYNYMGLIADGYNNDSIPAGTSRLSYYTYKKMTETLEGSDWDNIQIIQESDGVYIYKFQKGSKKIWVAWNDNSAEKQITISGISSIQVKITEAVPKYDSGKDVTDYLTAFNTETKSVQGGKIIITLKDKPVFAEE